MSTAASVFVGPRQLLEDEALAGVREGVVVRLSGHRRLHGGILLLVSSGVGGGIGGGRSRVAMVGANAGSV